MRIKYQFIIIALFALVMLANTVIDDTIYSGDFLEPGVKTLHL